MSSGEEHPTSDQLVEKITSSVKAERDSALASLLRVMKGVECDEGERKHLIKTISEQIASQLAELSVKEAVNTGLYGDKKLGCLSASLIILNNGRESDEERIYTFVLQIKPHLLNLLGDQDVRVRVLAGETFGNICKLLGPSVYLESKKVILELLESEYQRSKDIEGMIRSPETPIDPVGEVGPTDYKILSPQLGLSPAATPINPNVQLADVLKEAVSVLQTGGVPSGGSLDLANNLGCAQLESSLRCLQFIAKALGTQFGPLVDQHLLELILPLLHHQNRFVREAGFYLCGALIESELDLKSYGRLIVKELCSGLEDFCGQARIAAGIACRRFMLRLGKQDRDDMLLRTMLPRLCLCRYYMADTKFLLYSQESWKIIFAMDGPQLVSKYIDDVVAYYLEATTSDNHAVREAACMCLGEIARKIDSDIVTPLVPGILETLRRSFHDERWHVRDAACLASGTFFVNFPSECQGFSETMLPFYLENLEFPISVVRQGAAAALSNIVRAYGKAVFPIVIEKVRAGLTGLKQQIAETCNTVDLPGAGIINPEVKYSYPPGQGIALPYARPSQPWELADGCLYLIGDIAQIPECQSELPTLIPHIMEALQYRSYSQHLLLLETACKILPCLVNGIGKRPFKEYLSAFFEPIFYSVECDNSLTAGAGRVCLKELCRIYGPNIIRSRVEMFDARLVQYVDEG